MFNMIVLLIARSFRANLVSIPIPEKFQSRNPVFPVFQIIGKETKDNLDFFAEVFGFFLSLEQDATGIDPYFCHLIHIYPPICLLRGRLLDLVAALVAMFNFVPAAPFGHQECICPKCVRARDVSSCIPAGVIITCPMHLVTVK
jgi:hypothetical protein